jgi:hypothetical protein
MSKKGTQVFEQALSLPHAMIYQVRDAVLLIIAVMHLHREPQSWKSRPGEAPG